MALAVRRNWSRLQLSKGRERNSRCFGVHRLVNYFTTYTLFYGSNMNGDGCCVVVIVVMAVAVMPSMFCSAGGDGIVANSCECIGGNFSGSESALRDIVSGGDSPRGGGGIAIESNGHILTYFSLCGGGCEGNVTSFLFAGG